MGELEGEIVRRLDLIQATLRLAFAPALAAARAQIRQDVVNAAILDEATEWTHSTELQTKVSKQTGKATRTVRDRLNELVEQGVLITRGSERKVEYRNAGLV